MGNKTSHAANATGEAIFVKCQDNPTKVDFRIALDMAVKDVSAGVAFDFEDTTDDIDVGFVRVAPGDYLGFPSSKPYLSVMTQSGKVIADNYHPGTDISIIITPEYTIQQARYGSIWIGKDGEEY